MTTMKSATLKRRPAPKRGGVAAPSLPDRSGDGSKPHPGRRMTEAEFADWADEKTRAEWVDGEMIVMAAVSLDHGKTVSWVSHLVEDFGEFHDLGSVHGPEILVRLPKVNHRRLPDVAVVVKGGSSILRENVIDGAPDLIVEVVSPDSASRDWQQKYLDYARAGVKEYWVIDRLAGQMEAYALRPSGKAPGTYRRIEETAGKLASVVLKGFYLRPEWVLGDWKTGRRAAAKELGVN
jgi:Uma2 family endonuclease